MDGIALLRAQNAEMHRILEAAIGDCTSDMVGACLPGAKINSIGAIYAHTVFSEDGILNGALRGVTPVDFTGGWADKGPRPPQPACCASRATVPRPSHRSQYSGTNRPSCARRRGRPRHLGQIVRPGPGPLFARFPLSLMPPSVASSRR
jgi:hypothetical protein